MASILKTLYEGKIEIHELPFPSKVIVEALRRLEKLGLVKTVLTEKGRKFVEEEIRKTREVKI